MADTLASWVIEVKNERGWHRYAVTWKEYVDFYVQEAKERGYKEVRIRELKY